MVPFKMLEAILSERISLVKFSSLAAQDRLTGNLKEHH